MSLKALVWAFDQQIKPASVKFVLVALADNVHSESRKSIVWPSVPAICHKTSLDRKTVMTAIDRLEEMGFLKDTNQRAGTTKQVKVYEVIGLTGDDRNGNSTVFPTHQAEETVPFFPSKGTVFPGNSTVFPTNSTENGTRNQERTGKEPGKEPSNPPSSPPDEPEAGHRQNSDGSSVLGTFQLRIDPPPRSEPVPDSRHHDITFAWSDRFKRAFGCDYHFSGRDAATLKRFLAGSRETADAILKTAEDAWARSKTDRYASRSKMAATLHGLCTAYNDIRLELAGPSADRGRAAEDDPAYTGLGSLGIAVMP